MMLPPADQVYLACGFTDMRKGFDGLAALVQKIGRASCRERVYLAV